MEDYKIDYLERIKTLLDKQDVAGLDKFMLKIKARIEGDQSFNELKAEIETKNYDMALAITEELIYDNTNEDLEVDDMGGDDGEEDEFGYSSSGGGSEHNEDEGYY